MSYESRAKSIVIQHMHAKIGGAVAHAYFIARTPPCNFTLRMFGITTMPILTPTHELRRILVCRTDGLGDVVLTLPVAVAIRRLLPEAEISFMVQPEMAPIVRRIAE